MKFLEHPAVTAFGATTIMLVNLLEGLVSPYHTEYYHLSGDLRNVLVPVLLNFLGTWLLLTLLLSWARRHPRLLGWIYGLMGIVLGWLLVKNIASILNATLSHRQSLSLLLGFALLALSLLVPARGGRVVRHAQGLFVTLLGFVAISGAIMLAQVSYISGEARHLNAPRPLHQSLASAPPSRGHGRVIWIVFDELSYRQVYEHRYAGLKLPAFERLAQQSTVYTHAVAAGSMTEVVLPSLITGKFVDKVLAPAQGWPLALHDQSTGSWSTLDPHDTVFQDALNAGYSTAVSGWYNPYCRILPEVLDRCFWVTRGALPGYMFPEEGIAWNTAQPLLTTVQYGLRMLHLMRDRSSSIELPFHQQDYFDLYRAGDRMLADPRANFLLLHMPIPHPYGIYNRRKASFNTSWPSYLDNLALCDLYLAHVRQQMERDGTWDDATVVVMGDHSWRVLLGWAQAPEWTNEEAIASDHATFDDRPVYMVKLPRETAPAHIDAPFSALRTRSLFDQIFTGHIQTPQQLAAWSGPIATASRQP